MSKREKTQDKHGSQFVPTHVGALLALLVVAACSGGAAEDVARVEESLREGHGSECSWHRHTHHARGSVVGDRRIPYTPANDRAFIEFFIDHHEMAIAMAEHEVMHGETEDLKLLAQEMIEMQSAEVETMRAIASELSAPAPKAMPVDPHADADMEHMSSLRGRALDAMFLTEMIAHHAAGLPVVHRSRDMLRHEELRAIAGDMAKAQATEIGEMQSWRERLGLKGAGEDLAPAAEPGRPDMGLIGDRRISVTPANDVEFIDFFAPHHAMAIEMAELVISRGQNAEVKAMAEEARSAQAAEVEAMRSARDALTGTAESPNPPRDRHMQNEMDEMMKMSGGQLDRMFLHEMIAHHAAGIPTAHRSKPHLQAAELTGMADAIFASQSQEIGAMQRLLDGMP